MTTYEKLMQNRIIAILRGASKEKLLGLAQAIYKGGIKNIEITLVHQSEETVKESLEKINMLANCGLDINVGAGTVLTEKQVRQAYEAGAKYIISPDSKESVIKVTKELGLVSIPGALTPCEIAAAYDWGADIVKVFPINSLGLGYFKAIKAPLAHIPMAAVGGVNAENIADYFKAGAASVGVGGNFVANIDNLEKVYETSKLLCERAGCE